MCKGILKAVCWFFIGLLFSFLICDMPSVYLQFLETSPELGNNYSEVIAPQDIATYGGLCALASFDRAELKATNLHFSLFYMGFTIKNRKYMITS